ncbi:TPA: hypothetical protein SK292_001391 [Yersinia enterocolitica]|uniref:Uncharacterized protein n=1 Tax=Pseudomonas cichorii TaxID=36746 RepID=A0A3M4W4E8_PSECI|nr:hypothetical protein [Pseudomonas cichorii]RMR59038.1 hypothetical protein ALP84_00788 [Pseudomonas cichorii]HEI6926718.1 hypothetical protein [Yersinia enterocolitica]
MNKSPYLLDGRLSDVMAMIQVLALSEKTRRTEEGMTGELQGPPKSAANWIAVGLQHREFFRVKPEGPKPAHISLIARNAQEATQDEGGEQKRPLLSSDATAKLMQLAVDLHARQLQRSEAWRTTVIPIVIAVLAAVASIFSAFINITQKPQPVGFAGICNEARPLAAESPR